MTRDCGCPGGRPTAETSSATQAIDALRHQGCTCPLVYDAAVQRAVPYHPTRAQLSRCPYHALQPLASATATKG